MMLNDFKKRALKGLPFLRAKRSNTLKLACGESQSYSGAALKFEDRQGFVTEIATKHGKRLRRYLAARLSSSADVSDLVQEVFLRLLRLDRHEPIRNAEAYVMTIAGHVLHQHMVRSAVAPESLEVDLEMSSAPDPAQQVEAQQQLQVLDRILESLAFNVHAAFVMRLRDGLPLEEIAERLGVSRTMVKKYVARALDLCAEELAAEG